MESFRNEKEEMHMKLKNSFLSITLISALLFTGCGNTNAGKDSEDISNKEASDATGIMLLLEIQ